jgi:hypothetical protein
MFASPRRFSHQEPAQRFERFVESHYPYRRFVEPSGIDAQQSRRFFQKGGLELEIRYHCFDLLPLAPGVINNDEASVRAACSAPSGWKVIGSSRRGQHRKQKWSSSLGTSNSPTAGGSRTNTRRPPNCIPSFVCRMVPGMVPVRMMHRFRGAIRLP